MPLDVFAIEAALLAPKIAFDTAYEFIKAYPYTLVLVAIVTRIIYLRHFHPLAQFPGPFLASISVLYNLWSYFTFRQHEIEKGLHEKYGPVIRYGPNFLLVSDPTYLPVIYHKSAEKPDYYKSAGLGFAPATVGALTHKEHTRLKRRVISCYSTTSIRSMEPHLNEQIARWLSKITERFGNGETFDFAPWAQFLAYDVLSDIAFGGPFGFIETGTDVAKLVHSFHTGLPFASVLARLPILNHIFSIPGLKSFLPKAGDKHGFGALMTFRDRLLDERIDKYHKGIPTGRNDFVSNLLNARNPDGTPMSREELDSELLIVMIAGSDTTGVSFRQFMVRLLENPRVYRNVMTEIDEAYVSGKISKKIPTFEEVGKMPYYTAALREAVRMATLPAYLPRVVAPEGYEICGKFVPGGTEIACNPWVTNQNKEFYGKDADQYVPERWLGPMKQTMERYDFAFGFGSRACLGKSLALLEMHKAGIALLRLYEPSFAPKPANVDYEREIYNPGVFAERGIWIKLRKRRVAEWNC